MSKSDRFEYDFLRMTFNGVGITNLCSSAGTTSLWLGLHTADPADPGSTASEGGYAQYARVAVPRSTGGWSVSSGPSTGYAGSSPVANIDFPQNISTSTGMFTHASVYPASGSTGPDALYNGALSVGINFSQNVTPRLTTASVINED